MKTVTIFFEILDGENSNNKNKDFNVLNKIKEYFKNGKSHNWTNNVLFFDTKKRNLNILNTSPIVKMFS